MHDGDLTNGAGKRAGSDPRPIMAALEVKNGLDDAGLAFLGAVIIIAQLAGAITREEAIVNRTQADAYDKSVTVLASLGAELIVQVRLLGEDVVAESLGQSFRKTAARRVARGG